MAQTLQSDLSKIGVKIKLLAATPADFYVKYLQVPSVAKRGVWDLALAGWGPDWYGDARGVVLQPAVLRAARPTRRSAATSGSTTTRR